ncbi:hypothetical protein L3Q82_018827 [Scortum barcoo]|uniref:Uncharacterized protein n=1 Tax=Scortum barcoo TaxID=214431 RepID=A0ACB8VFQ6_9TELE|nr:hypothetical protein L3Q82_018827 [Scortum barcoo]
MKSCGSQTGLPPAPGWLCLEILSIKIMNRTGDKGQALPESNMHWEQACQPRQPHNIQRFEVLRADLIHPRRLATAELTNYLSDFGLGVMDESTSETPASASSLEGKSVGLRRSSKYFFHRPTMSPVEVNSSPPCTVNSVGRVLLPPSEAPDGLPESLRGRPPIVLLHGLTELLPDPSFCLQDRPGCGLLGLPVPVNNCVRSPTGQHGPIGLLLQPDGIPYFRCPPPGSGLPPRQAPETSASTT